MTISGIDAVALGIEDLEAGGRFYRDFGLAEVEHARAGAEFRTLDGSQLVLRQMSDPGLPPPAREGVTIREITWAVASRAAISEIAGELSKDRAVSEDEEGTIHSVDEDGYRIAFRVERRTKIEPAPNLLNIYGAEPNRPVNVRVDFLAPVRPASIAHVVVMSPDVPRATRFYVDRLRFRVSDVFAGGFGAFLRSSGSSYHHNLFLIKGNPGLHHIAFPVTDFNAVMLGGMRLHKQGWQTRLGPGRHIIGSNYFWYFRTPLGGAMELTADMDRADDNWQVREWAHVPENTAAWSTVFQER